MFEIISQNMREIAPTGNTLEEDRVLWEQAMQEELRNPDKHWVLAFSGETLAGYVLYRIAEGVLRMDEIQIAKAYQGDKKTFALLKGRMLDDARMAKVRELRAYTNKKCEKAQGILHGMGLSVIGETPRGFRYAGGAEKLYEA